MNFKPNAEYIKTSLKVTEIQQLGTAHLRIKEGAIVEGHFQVIGENNQGKLIVIEYLIPSQPGQIRLATTGGILHKPQRPVTKAEFEAWQKDHSFVFPI
jgi:hypothetical protein